MSGVLLFRLRRDESHRDLKLIREQVAPSRIEHSERRDQLDITSRQFHPRILRCVSLPSPVDEFEFDAEI